MNFNTKCFICVVIFVVVNIIYIINDELFISEHEMDNTDKLSIPSEILLDITPDTGNTFIHFNLINLIHDPIMINDDDTKQQTIHLLSLLIRSVMNLKISEIYQLIQIKNKNQETILDLIHKMPTSDQKEIWIQLWNKYIELSTKFHNAKNNYM